jgi:hypothetical protein
LIGVAVMLRNWLTVQLIMAAVVLTLLVLAQLVRLALDVLPPSLPSGAFWWSPYVVVAIAMWFLLVVPSGWAYWMLPQGERWGGGLQRKLTDSIWPVLACCLVFGAAGFLAWIAFGFKGILLFKGFLLWVFAAGIIPALAFWAWALAKYPTQGDTSTSDDRQFQSEGAATFCRT